jgi:1,4-alpha-glucan branching enzyme
MGCEIAQPTEWSHETALSWALLDEPRRRGVQRLVHDLNAAYHDIPALHRRDCVPEGYRWVVGDDRSQSVFAWLRFGGEGDKPALVVCNFTPVLRRNYRIGVPRAGTWHEVIKAAVSEAHLLGIIGENLVTPTKRSTAVQVSAMAIKDRGGDQSRL